MSGHSCLHDGLPAPPRQELSHLEPTHAYSQKQNGRFTAKLFCTAIIQIVVFAVLSGWQISHREAHDQPCLRAAVAAVR